MPPLSSFSDLDSFAALLDHHSATTTNNVIPINEDSGITIDNQKPFHTSNFPPPPTYSESLWNDTLIDELDETEESEDEKDANIQTFKKPDEQDLKATIESRKRVEEMKTVFSYLYYKTQHNLTHCSFHQVKKTVRRKSKQKKRHYNNNMIGNSCANGIQFFPPHSYPPPWLQSLPPMHNYNMSMPMFATNPNLNLNPTNSFAPPLPFSHQPALNSDMNMWMNMDMNMDMKMKMNTPIFFPPHNHQKQSHQPQSNQSIINPKDILVNNINHQSILDRLSCL